MHQRAPLECEERLARVAVPPVLRACVLDDLSGERVLQLERDDRDSVQVSVTSSDCSERGEKRSCRGESEAVRRVTSSSSGFSSCAALKKAIRSVRP